MATATSVPPEDRPQWTHALIAAELSGTGTSASQAGRILADLELRPHKVRGWLRRADDDRFWAQAAAVCDAYLRPPPDTVVICIDEKTGIQAKYRKYPGRLPAPGRPARREFEYVRNGTVSVIAALHVATGQLAAELGVRPADGPDPDHAWWWDAPLIPAHYRLAGPGTTPEQAAAAISAAAKRLRA